LDDGEVVAVKRLKKDAFKTGVNLGAIKELQALQELSHPNVLAVRGGARAHARGNGAWTIAQSNSPHLSHMHLLAVAARCPPRAPRACSYATRLCTVTGCTWCSSVAPPT
jgi:hypothetical protein